MRCPRSCPGSPRRFRCFWSCAVCVFIGVCVEFVAAVAWLAELFEDPRRRERVIGYTQAFSSFGGFLVATFNGVCITYAASFPAIAGFGLAIADPHAAWRYTLMSGRYSRHSADPDPSLSSGVPDVA